VQLRLPVLYLRQASGTFNGNAEVTVSPIVKILSGFR